MGLACVEPLEASALPLAQKLASSWEVPLASEYQASSGVKAVVSATALGLGFCDQKRGKPYYCDFQTRAWRLLMQNGLPKNHIFRRALGIRAPGLKVVDATAGFGQDAIMALAAGCEVMAIERSHVVCAVLQDGINRAVREDERWAFAIKRFMLVEADAKQLLLTTDRAIDVIYLDPMFSKPKKTAKSPKEMQLLQELLEHDSLEEELDLFNAALKRARQRVVVKRPLKARALGANPAHSFKGQSIRYDVYLRS